MQDTGFLGLVHWDDPGGWYGFLVCTLKARLVSPVFETLLFKVVNSPAAQEVSPLAAKLKNNHTLFSNFRSDTGFQSVRRG